MGLFRIGLLALFLAVPGQAQAHSGGALDLHGCHADRSRGNYHCHRGEMDGLTFTSRGAMLQAKSSGEVPEQPKKKEGFLSRWFGGDKEKPSAESAAKDQSDASAGSAGAPAATGEAVDTPQAMHAPAHQHVEDANAVEHRLRVLKGLYEMELITEEEYTARRTEILGEL